MLKGDVDPVQQLALLYLMKKEMTDLSELEWERFKMTMVAHNPGHAKEILERLDGAHEAEKPEVVLTEEFEPDEKGFMLEELRQFGFVVTDD